jgi:bifunctional DNA-binding transcriptional regulator/antitoxin component of YhaV-PrlF toxin-antitoxin module
MINKIDIPTFEVFSAFLLEDQVNVLKGLMSLYKVSDISEAWGFNNPAAYYYFLRTSGLHPFVVSERGRPRLDTLKRSHRERKTDVLSTPQPASDRNKNRVMGIVRTIDDLGRVVLPQEMRELMGYREGFHLELYEDDVNERIIFKPYRPLGMCMDCGTDDDVVSFKMVFLCISCMRAIVKDARPYSVIN